MFSVSKPQPNRIDITIEGRISKTEMQTALDELINLSANLESGSMLYTVRNLKLPALGAIAVELRYLPKALGLVRKIKYAAFLTDSDLLEHIAKLKDRFLPGVTIKTFAHDGHDEAESWLRQCAERDVVKAI